MIVLKHSLNKEQIISHSFDQKVEEQKVIKMLVHSSNPFTNQQRCTYLSMLIKTSIFSVLLTMK